MDEGVAAESFGHVEAVHSPRRRGDAEISAEKTRREKEESLRGRRWFGRGGGEFFFNAETRRTQRKRREERRREFAGEARRME